MKPAADRSIVFLDASTLGEPAEALSLLAQCYPCTFHDTTLPHQVADRITGRAVAVTNKVPIRAETLESPGAEALQLVSVAATGVDVVDLESARRRGIAVTNVTGYSTHSVAEHTWALIFELASRTGNFAQAVRDGAWERSPIFTVFGWPREELFGKTLGIVGLGAIGGAVATLGRALGMEVVVSTRPGAPGAPPPDRVPFEEVLARADVLSLHCPLTPTTERLLGEKALASMKRTAWIVNTARGGLLDEVALIAALRARKLGGAALDVISQEPPPVDHPVLSAARELPNLVVTPHVAWTSAASRRRLTEQLADGIHAFFRGETRNRVV